jgi:hypothetical protein
MKTFGWMMPKQEGHAWTDDPDVMQKALDLYCDKVAEKRKRALFDSAREIQERVCAKICAKYFQKD